ncbi:CrcB family protein [Micromonospora sp. NPDC005413]|uniref:fluoride efflux transporter FluC n=1 Tax=Micromonospora sp. NPDC005413 TaxID=3154563 RepID=UPI0033B1BB71
MASAPPCGTSWGSASPHPRHRTSPGSPLCNMVGAFALGAVMTLLAAHRLPGPWGKPFLSTGLIGGFTTWSHFIVESDQLIGARRSGVGIIYLVLSIVGGVIAAALGARLAELRVGRPAEGRR